MNSFRFKFVEICFRPGSSGPNSNEFEHGIWFRLKKANSEINRIIRFLRIQTNLSKFNYFLRSEKKRIDFDRFLYLCLNHFFAYSGPFQTDHIKWHKQQCLFPEKKVVEIQIVFQHRLMGKNVIRFFWNGGSKYLINKYIHIWSCLTKI